VAGRERSPKAAATDCLVWIAKQLTEPNGNVTSAVINGTSCWPRTTPSVGFSDRPSSAADTAGDGAGWPT